MCYSTLGMNPLVVMLSGWLLTTEYTLRVSQSDLALYCVVPYIAACVDASRMVFWDRSGWRRKLNQQKMYISGFQSVNKNGYQCQPLWKIEKWLPSHNYQWYGKKFKLLTSPSPKSLGLRFSECWQKWNISVSNYGKTGVAIQLKFV